MHTTLFRSRPDITTLAGSYLGRAHVLDALDVDLEVEFVGWDLEGL